MKLFNISLSQVKSPVIWLMYFVFLACILPIAFFACKRPAYNWDMLAYMALAEKMEKSDINDVHAVTYNSAKLNIPSDDYAKLIEGPLRQQRMESPAEFNRVLPFYAVKPLYIWLSYFFHKSGFSLPLSTVLPSIVAYLLTGLLVFHWLNIHHKLIFSFGAGLVIMFSSVMIEVARLSTPDGLSALFLLAAFYFILERPSLLFAFLFLTASVLSRLDNIILSGLLLSYLFFCKKWAKKISLIRYLVMLGILAAVYVMVSGLAKEYNWSSFYYPDFVKYYHPGHPSQPLFSISGYMALFYERVIMAILYTHASIFLLLVLIWLSMSYQGKFRDLPFELLFCLILVFTIVIRFVLFPDLEDRFYVAYYLVILIMFMRQYKQVSSIVKTVSQTKGNENC
ncbi:MAG: hypothetical protein ABI675_14770 [Chitinophagaceae bacterium]